MLMLNASSRSGLYKSISPAIIARIASVRSNAAIASDSAAASASLMLSAATKSNSRGRSVAYRDRIISKLPMPRSAKEYSGVIPMRSPCTCLRTPASFRATRASSILRSACSFRSCTSIAAAAFRLATVRATHAAILPPTAVAAACPNHVPIQPRKSPSIPDNCSPYRATKVASSAHRQCSTFAFAATSATGLMQFRGSVSLRVAPPRVLRFQNLAGCAHLRPSNALR
jgi:hypothetical protein